MSERECAREIFCPMDLLHFKRRLTMVAGQKRTHEIVHIHSLMLERATLFVNIVSMAIKLLINRYNWVAVAALPSAQS